jgi:hypothetical protein
MLFLLTSIEQPQALSSSVMVGFSDVTDQSVRRLRWFNLKSMPHDNRSFFALTPFAAASIGSFGRSKIGTAFCQKKILWSRAWHPRSALRPAERCRFCRMLASSQLASAAFAGAHSQSLRAGCMGCMGVRGVQPHRSGSCHSTIGPIPPFAWVCPCYPCLECRLWLAAVAPVSSLGSLGWCIEVRRPLPSWIQNTLTRPTMSTPNGKKKVTAVPTPGPSNPPSPPHFRTLRPAAVVFLPRIPCLLQWFPVIPTDLIFHLWYSVLLWRRFFGLGDFTGAHLCLALLKQAGSCRRSISRHDATRSIIA